MVELSEERARQVLLPPLVYEWSFACHVLLDFTNVSFF